LKDVLVRFLENSCFYKLKQNKDYFENELFEVYKKMLSENLFNARDSDYMPIIAFERILRLALDLKHIEWACEFISKCIDKIHGEYREHVKNYSESLIFFYQKDYPKAIELVSRIKRYEFLTNLNIGAVLLKSYYELNYTEEIIYLLDSYKHPPKSGSTSWAEKFSNFIKLFERVFKLKLNPGDGFDIDDIKKDLSGTEEIMEREWLEEKLAELRPA
jgi:hypothetical protein